MSSAVETPGPRPARPVAYAVLLALLFLDVLVVLDPRLLLHNQSPTFLANWSSFIERVLYWPGGLIEYASAALTQAYLVPRLGALMLTVVVGLLCLATDLAMRACGARREHPWAFAPAIALMALLHQFALPPGPILALSAAILTAWGYLRLTGGGNPVATGSTGMNAVGRVAVALLLICMLYPIAGGVVLVTAGLCGLFELFVRRRRVTGLVLVLLGGCVPWVAANWVYHIGLREAMLRLTTIEFDLHWPIASIALYASVLLAIPVAVARPMGLLRHRSQGSGVATWPAWMGWGRIALLALAGTLAAGSTFDPDIKAALAVDFHTRQRQWSKALESASRFRWAGTVPIRAFERKLAALCHWYGFPTSSCSSVPILTSYDATIHNINFALVQNGLLLDEMFSYPQLMGVSVVRLQPDALGPYVAHSYNADVLLELGHVNEAQRVACESLANIGPRPWLLERLAVICVCKEQANAARSFLNVLADMPPYRHSARTSIEQLTVDPTWSARPEIARARGRLFKEDHVGYLENIHPDEQLLRYLLVANPHNRTAYDYIMAHFLIGMQHDQVARYAQYLDKFGYSHMPRHCAEAILFDAHASGKRPPRGGMPIGPEITQRFKQFQQALDALGGPGGPDNRKTRDALVGSFGDTYWFYALFGNTFFDHHQPAASSSEGSP